MTREEAQLILDAGLSFFPIYQDGGYCAEYFNVAQGNTDAIKAVTAAQKLGILKGTIICFAVDFDAYDYQVFLILLHWQAVCMLWEVPIALVSMDLWC